MMLGQLAMKTPPIPSFPRTVYQKMSIHVLIGESVENWHCGPPWSRSRLFTEFANSCVVRMLVFLKLLDKAFENNPHDSASKPTAARRCLGTNRSVPYWARFGTSSSLVGTPAAPDWQASIM